MLGDLVANVAIIAEGDDEGGEGKDGQDHDHQESKAFLPPVVSFHCSPRVRYKATRGERDGWTERKMESGII